jgi:NADPH:quinone reductase-like Zn-dependent oxidoreductase
MYYKYSAVPSVLDKSIVMIALEASDFLEAFHIAIQSSNLQLFTSAVSLLTGAFSLMHWHILQFSRHETGVTHVLVTGGAGYIGSHATLRLLRDNYRVTIVVNFVFPVFTFVPMM